MYCLLTRMLEEAGYRNVAATMHPLEVCALHRKNRYDLILLDLQMPGMDGFQVMEGLKTNEEDGYLPVIVLTAQPGHKLRALQAGAKDFISKPFDLVEVKTRIYNMIEVRLLYRRLERFNALLEQTVRERTAELRESEARYRSLTELASDWYWEQDESGSFTKVSGPVLDMLGIRVDTLEGDACPPLTDGWDETQRRALQAKIGARQPFLDFTLNRAAPDGSQLQFRISGEPMFNSACRFLGYRGIGIGSHRQVLGHEVRASTLPVAHHPRQNHLLAALPAADFERLSPRLELVPMCLGDAVYEPGVQLEHAYFPITAIVSLHYVTLSGASLEIAGVGPEGIVGISLFMGGNTTPSSAVVRTAGHAYRLERRLLGAEFTRGGALQALLLRYTQALITQMCQTAACNRHHSVEQQLSCMLLGTVDRLPLQELTMTQELVGSLLGVRRESITEAAGRLQQGGFIKYRRGHVDVVDRIGLQSRACECYAVVKTEMNRLLPRTAASL